VLGMQRRSPSTHDRACSVHSQPQQSWSRLRRSLLGHVVGSG
jgi:hypothetical protein